MGEPSYQFEIAQKNMQSAKVGVEKGYGKRFARDNPHKTDAETASRWIEQGVNTVLTTIVFHKEMSWMHERFLRWTNSQDRRLVPTCLKLFDSNIESATRQAKGLVIDECEKEYSRWRARCRGWKKNKDLWRPEMWGPFAPGNRVPNVILAEMAST